MDTLTQGLLGAVCGQALFADKLGFRRAAAWGAVGGLIPDVDVLPIAFLGPLAEFKYHRAVTHSLWFSLAAGPLLGWAVWRWQRRRRATEADAREAGTLAAWTSLFIVALVTHPLLDLFTTYGTMLLWPNPHRFALDGVAIIDPIYSGILVLALVVGRFARGSRGLALAQTAGVGALVATTWFLFYGLHLNDEAEAEARRQLAPRTSPALTVRAYPTLFQPWLRRVVARDGRDVYVGLLSTWAPHPVRFSRFVEPRDARIDAALATPEGELFTWFAMGQTTARVLEDGGGGASVEVDDLRYGYGDEPAHGLWGLRFLLGPDGRPSGPAERFNRRPRAAVVSTLGLLWRATFAPASAGATP
jgi:inner membrane protein